jgi:uncharacterized membrane protein
MVAQAAEGAQKAFYDFAWRVQLSMVYTGSGLVLITGVLLWFGGHFKLLTGWLLLGLLLYIAAMGLDGAFLSPNLRRARTALAESAAPQTADAAATTIQLVAWFLLVVVVFLMVDRPF